MNQKLPLGLINAITTPFNQDNTLDTGAFAQHLQMLEQNKIEHILLAGTTGEFFSLTLSEKIKLLKTARKNFNGGIMFHVGSNCLKDTLALAASAVNEGADTIASILPFFLATAPKKGLILYLQKISLATELPFLIYNFPKHTQVGLDLEILAQVPHWGIKDSSGNLEFIKATSNYFIGSDTKLLVSHEQGGKGFISARSNAEPALYSCLNNALLAGELTKAKELHKKMLKICDTLSGPSQIRLVKEHLSKKLPGYPTKVRLPLV